MSRGHHRRTCGAWKLFDGRRHCCSYLKLHDGQHSWEARPPKERRATT